MLVLIMFALDILFNILLFPCFYRGAVGSGAAGSWSINNLGPRIVARNFQPGFLVEHFIKGLHFNI